ncbi:RNA-binding protein 25-like isoform X2 [Ornithodoros turicata]|uniref:RNA-binding protein 25-like isoform X2 n=1 Tax=Ornithodoros turicata TaxID=34597 RepID=UPI0031388BBA
MLRGTNGRNRLSEPDSSPTCSDSWSSCTHSCRGSERKALIEEKAISYQKRLRRWEARELRMAKQHAQRKQQEEARLLQQIKAAREARAFLESYDDRLDDVAFYNGVAMLRKLFDRSQEKLSDDQDRLEEETELKELREKLQEESKASALRERQRTAAINRVHAWKARCPAAESAASSRCLHLAGGASAEVLQSPPISRALCDAASAHPAATPAGIPNGYALKELPATANQSSKERASVSAAPSYDALLPVPYSPTMPSDPRTGARSSATSSGSSRSENPRKKIRVVCDASISGESISSGEVDLVVFGTRRTRVANSTDAAKQPGAEEPDVCQEKDEMQRLLNETLNAVSSDDEDDVVDEHRNNGQVNGVEVDAESSKRQRNGTASCDLPAAGMTSQEKRKYIESLIPARRDDLFRYKVERNLMDKSMVQGHILPWICKKMAKLTGKRQPVLEKCLRDMLRKGSSPAEMLVHVFPVLHENSEPFVVRLWRLVIYKTECKKLGLLR